MMQKRVIRVDIAPFIMVAIPNEELKPDLGVVCVIFVLLL